MRAVVTHKEMIKPLIGIMRFKTEPMDFIPGQFSNIKIMKDRNPLVRPFSMVSVPGKELEFYIKGYPDGQMVKHLLKLEEGDEAEITGPFGGFTLKDTDAEIYFIGGGSGVAPLAGMSRYLETSERKRIFLHGASEPKELGYMEELKDMEHDYIPTVDSPDEDWEGKVGRIDKHLDLLTNKDAEVYVCGPPPMVENVVRQLKERGFSKVYTERFY